MNNEQIKNIGALILGIVLVGYSVLSIKKGEVTWWGWFLGGAHTKEEHPVRFFFLVTILLISGLLFLIGGSILLIVS